MTMTDVRAAALGEFPPPPPCPMWCEIEHEKHDFRSTVTWIRPHLVQRSVDIPDGRVTMIVSVTDRYMGGQWDQRDPVELSVSPQLGQFVNASRPDDVAALVALVGLISPEVAESIQAAALLVCSPAVTPAGEDQ
jgi:hypothetical protein